LGIRPQTPSKSAFRGNYSFTRKARSVRRGATKRGHKIVLPLLEKGRAMRQRQSKNSRSGTDEENRGLEELTIFIGDYHCGERTLGKEWWQGDYRKGTAFLKRRGMKDSQQRIIRYSAKLIFWHGRFFPDILRGFHRLFSPHACSQT